jgi:hypothetical protein
MQYCTKHSWPMSPEQVDKLENDCEHLGFYSGATTPNEINGYCFLNERPITEDHKPLKECNHA